MMHRIKMWDSKDEELMGFFGLSFSSSSQSVPRFGSSLRVDLLTDGTNETFRHVATDEGYYALPPPDREKLTTLLNLAVYFGYAQWGVANLQGMLTKTQATPVDPRIINLIVKYAQDRFHHDRVEPLRNYLLQQRLPVYFYCIPASSNETNLRTGELFRAVGPQVLTALPTTPEGARERGWQEAGIRGPRVLTERKTTLRKSSS